MSGNVLLKGKLRGRGALPVKRNINLAVIGVEKFNFVLMVPAVLVIILLACVFSKFAVVDRLEVVNRAQAEEAALQSQLDSTMGELKNYGDVTDAYAHYTYSGMTYDEKNQADRLAAIDLIDTIVIPQASVSSWSISGNKINLPIIGSSLEQLNKIASDLEEDERVDFCVVTTASTNTRTSEDSASEVTGQVTIYLVGALEGGNE